MLFGTCSVIRTCLHYKDCEEIFEVHEKDCVLFLYIMPSLSKAPGSKNGRWKSLRNFVKCFCIHITLSEVRPHPATKCHHGKCTILGAFHFLRRQVTDHNAVTSHPFDSPNPVLLIWTRDIERTCLFLIINSLNRT